MNRLSANPTVDRRTLLRTAAAVAGATALTTGCAPLTVPDGALSTGQAPAIAPGREPRTVTGASTARVAFVKSDDRAEGVRRALDLLAPPDVAGKRVLLKPNFNSADPPPGSTHPAVLRTVIEQLQAGGAAQITIADRSGMGNTAVVMRQLGVPELAAELGCATLVLDDLPADEWVMVNAAVSHWSQGFPLARCCVDSDALVQLCCLKTHRFGGHFTLSLKNSVGLVAKHRPGDSHNYMGELHSSPHQRRMIAEINAAYRPALVVLDGVDAFVNGGPDRGDLVHPGVVLAGTDRVALDAVGVALLRYFGTTPEVSRGSIFAQEQIARAVELGVGVDGPEKIELATDDTASAEFAAEIRALLDA